MLTEDDKIRKVLKEGEPIPPEAMELRILFELQDIIYEANYVTNEYHQWEVQSCVIIDDPYLKHKFLVPDLECILNRLEFPPLRVTALLPFTSRVLFTTVTVSDYTIFNQYQALIKSYEGEDYEYHDLVEDIMQIYTHDGNIPAEDILTLIVKIQVNYLIGDCYPALREKYTPLLQEAFENPQIQERIIQEKITPRGE